MQSEKKYRSLFDKSPYSIILFDFNGKIIDINTVTEKKFLFSKEELTQEESGNISLLFREYSTVILEKAKRENLNSFSQSKEIIGYNKYGEEMWVRIRYYVVNLEGKMIVQMIIEDISKMISSKIAYKIIEKNLQELDVIIENAPLAILILNNEGNILRSNKVAENLLKIDAKSMLKKNIFQLFKPNNQESLKIHYKAVYETDTPIKTEIILNDEEEKKIIEVISIELRYEDYSVIQSFLSDITERKIYENYQNKLMSELQTSLEFKSKFLANMSHELRTPLNAILGFSQLLLEESYGSINENQKDFISDIDSAGNYLLSLVNTVLDLSKIEAGKMDLDLREIKLYEIIEEINAVIKPLYTQKNLEFIVKNVNFTDVIIADRLRFKQILFNLLSNAIKFTEMGSVILEFNQDNDNWHFKIEDTGIGIKESECDVIFREFGRVKERVFNQVQGAGLGLALTKKLVELHFGNLWFESVFGKGSTFFFTLPKSIKNDLYLGGKFQIE
jgi:PAS domain S-box-containing protein